MELLTIQEAASVLRLSTSWVRQKVFRRQIKYVKIGSRVFIPRETLDELIENSVRHPTDSLLSNGRG